MKNFISLIGIFGLLALVSALESFDLNKDNRGSLSILADSSSDQPVNVDVSVEEMIENMIPVLELKLVDRKKADDGDYYLETYQEFEVYKDAKGNIIKRKPTGHFEYLRYEI